MSRLAAGTDPKPLVSGRRDSDGMINDPTGRAYVKFTFPLKSKSKIKTDLVGPRKFTDGLYVDQRIKHLKQRYTHDFQARNPAASAQSGGPAQQQNIPLSVRVVPKLSVAAKRRGSADSEAEAAAPKKPPSPRLEENEPYVKVESFNFAKAKKPMFREVQVGEAKDSSVADQEDSDRESPPKKGPIKGWFIQEADEVARPSTTQQIV